MFDVQKKWTIIVSYGGATEDMKLAICFRHEYMWFTYSIDLRTCRIFRLLCESTALPCELHPRREIRVKNNNYKNKKIKKDEP